MVWCIIPALSNACYLIVVKQPVKQLGNEELSGRNSLIWKQKNAGSLANLIPSSEFEMTETQGVSPEIESDHIKKDLKDDIVRLVESEVIPICEYFFPLEKIFIVQVINST